MRAPSMPRSASPPGTRPPRSGPPRPDPPPTARPTTPARSGPERRRQGFAFCTIAVDSDWVRQGAAASLRRMAVAPEGGFDPAGTVALVTGSNRGIGSAIVAALAEAGVKRIYAGHRTGRAAPEGKGVVPVALDITDAGQIAAAVERCGDVTLLINNAGVNFNAPLLAPTDPNGARVEIETNYLGTLAMCRA